MLAARDDEDDGGRTLLTLDAGAVARALPYRALIDALDAAFRSEVVVPVRAHHEIALPEGAPATLLMMPAWESGTSIGVKIATVFPDNAAKSLPAVFATYVLLDGETGAPQAVLDGTELTLRRTACASALASSYLSRRDAATLAMIGTGNLAPHLVAAHATARDIGRVIVWGRRAEAADALAIRLQDAEFEVTVAEEISDAVAEADIVSCATLATQPLVRGEWLRPGQHLDLVGAFRPDMAEADSDALARADVYVDTREGAFAEAGEIVQAFESGALREKDVIGELRDLATGAVHGRRDDERITVFKSVGTGLEDLAAAALAMRSAG